jgi:hypothetical protein
LAKVDAVVTDPPYKLTSGGNTPGGMMGGWLDDYNMTTDDIVECDISWREIHAAFAGCLCGRCRPIRYGKRPLCVREGAAAKEANLGFHNLLVWDKVGATANRWYMKNCEFVTLSLEGPRKENCQRWFKTIDPLSAS